MWMSEGKKGELGWLLLWCSPSLHRLLLADGAVLQVLGSLNFLHSLGLIHSDLKPENILIKSYSRWAHLGCLQQPGHGLSVRIRSRVGQQ